ncbi:MAG: hypothetical protein ACRDZQ_02530 [Acidimicrobiales bacterium]
MAAGVVVDVLALAETVPDLVAPTDWRLNVSRPAGTPSVGIEETIAAWQALEPLLGQRLPQASISAIERPTRASAAVSSTLGDSDHGSRQHA